MISEKKIRVLMIRHNLNTSPFLYVNHHSGPLFGSDAEWTHLLKQIKSRCSRFVLMSVSVFFFFCLCQIKGKKPIKTRVSQIFLSPFFTMLWDGCTCLSKLAAIAAVFVWVKWVHFALLWSEGLIIAIVTFISIC